MGGWCCLLTVLVMDQVHEETIKRGCYPSPLNYNGFPKSVCTSINEVEDPVRAFIASPVLLLPFDH
eukprot:753233-Hanusia_phi.AAC.2